MVDSTERILIVDDEEIVRMALNRKLTKEGYQCKEADCAAHALETMKQHPAELVILDINMPGKPGNQFLPELRVNFPDTAVIMASGVTNTDIIAQCIRDGAQDYICKPLHFDDVLTSIGLALDKRMLELQIREYERCLKQKTGGKVMEIRKLFFDAIESLVTTLEANDRDIAGHSQRVTGTAVAIAQKIGMPPESLEDMHWASLLHDVGKIAIDPRILNKPAKLTPEEYRYVMTHATIGPNILKPLVNEWVVESISHHHDHYDGTGLDQVVVGEDIPLGARILAIADAYDAMTSDRPYRPAMSKEAALEEIRRCSGTQFDPSVAGAFLSMSMSPAA